MASKETPWVSVPRMVGIRHPNFMNFPLVVLDGLDIDGCYMAKKVIFPNRLSGYHVFDRLKKCVF